ncbi:TLC domain-containing protein [Globomyces pollinis-pini]|nr:TLC domain-containing protein [Globomyces pollinis-pini]
MIVPDSFYSYLGFERAAIYSDQILILAAVWQLLYLLTDYCSNRFFPVYRSMDDHKKANWGMHFVSLIHAVIISTLCFPILFNRTLLDNPILGVDVYAENVYTIAAGYFIWDLYISAKYWRLIGAAFVFHGAACLSISICLYRPVYQYYGAVFLMFEVSTIFLNIHWFCDKLNMTGTLFQLINGIFLISAFFGVRICYGTYQIYYLYVDSFKVWDKIPGYYFYLYAFVTVTLQPLNLFWFRSMIKAIISRFSPKKTVKKD